MKQQTFATAHAITLKGFQRFNGIFSILFHGFAGLYRFNEMCPQDKV